MSGNSDSGSVGRALRELAETALASATVLEAEFASAAELMRVTVKAGRTLFFCGNGGSAADAQHLATEYVVRYMRARRAARLRRSRSRRTRRCSPPRRTTSASRRSSRGRSRHLRARAICS